MYERIKGHLLILVLLLLTSVLVYITWSFGNSYFRVITLRAGGGSPGGTVREAIRTVRDVIEKEVRNVKIEIVDAGGTLENLERLNAGPQERMPDGSPKRIDLAIITEGTVPSISPAPTISTFARLYVNALQVVALKSAEIHTLSNISENHIVVLPPEKSASKKRVEVVLTHYNLMRTRREFRRPESFDNAADLLRKGQAHVAFFGGGVTVRAIADHLRENTELYQFVPIEFAAAMENRYPQFFQYTLLAGTYSANPPFPTEDVITIASYNSLVGRSSLEEDLGGRYIYEMTKALFTSKSLLVSKHPAMALMTEDFSTSPEHPLFQSAIQYYLRDKPTDWSRLGFWFSMPSSCLFFLISLWVSVKQYKKQ